jgi:RNA polymerase sigma-70 factor, ECF subfamily
MSDLLSELDALLCHAQAGDRAAFDRLVVATAPLVRSWLALQVRQLDQVDDLAQEVFLHVYDHLAEYRPGSNGLAWLKAIARNQALGHWRAHQRRSAAHERYCDAVRSVLGETAQELDEVERPDLLGRLRACVEQLSDRTRALITQRYDDDVSVEQMAVQRNQSANQVSVSLWRVRRTLADCIADDAAGRGA